MSTAGGNINFKQGRLWAFLLALCSRRFFFYALLIHVFLLLCFGRLSFFRSLFLTAEKEPAHEFICAQVNPKPPGGNSAPPVAVQTVTVPQVQTPILQSTLKVTTLREFNIAKQIPDASEVIASRVSATVTAGTGTGETGTGVGTGLGDEAGSGVGLGGGKIFGQEIRGRNLYVVIDISSSMLPYIEPVFEEVRRDFPNASFRYSRGCYFLVKPVKELPDPQGDKWKEEVAKRFINPSGIPGAKDIKGPDLYTRMSDCILDILKGDNKVDAIYLFADYQDGVDVKSGLLESILSAARSKSHTPQFVFHSIDKQNDSLAKIASDTKGSFFVKKIDDKLKKK